ncbi:Holliday junction DNA helicase RuvA [Candidatus Kaiserbacteria bacterium RIFCSPHIGHO2_02_FULL_49_34]|uniref:Holliday junction branch migration complex subunit RuvA n=1 Tax=Candidatus Kaiserbacteria bacterium RIFCSPHIGHO2_02_FULL_49_34 TaxID=1798491 RepID=A0A1F6DKZ8_9BACT|nr:MAG: Holliday junction DNA helicase RuvA [Candidatus Kaiserbacteria bacterium RIFCSPHIGHO2_02_FULL_49_34]
MIRSLRGTVIAHEPETTLLEVYGVGYRLTTLPSFLPIVGEEHFLHTYMVVREDALSLFGFYDRAELDMFELLLKIPKVGPKSAMQFLKQAQLNILKRAILNEDPSYLDRLSDISKKNAEKIVLALKGKIDITDIMDITEENDTVTNIRTEVAEALIALGYAPKEARDAARELPNDIADMQVAMRVTLAMIGKK